MGHSAHSYYTYYRTYNMQHELTYMQGLLKGAAWCAKARPCFNISTCSHHTHRTVQLVCCSASVTSVKLEPVQVSCELFSPCIQGNIEHYDY